VKRFQDGRVRARTSVEKGVFGNEIRYSYKAITITPVFFSGEYWTEKDSITKNNCKNYCDFTLYSYADQNDTKIYTCHQKKIDLGGHEQL